MKRVVQSREKQEAKLLAVRAWAEKGSAAGSQGGPSWIS